MAVDTVSANTAAEADRISGSRTRLADNFETFLTLLTTQLKNQDPLAPLDSNQFTQQIVQLTGVEQQLLTNDLLRKLVDTSSRGLGEAVSVLGKEVSADISTRTLQGGKANWTYELGQASNTVKLEILDSTGRVVRTLDANGAAAGDHTLAWDGKDASGRQLPDGGNYALQVTARDSGGSGLYSKVKLKGIVTGIESGEDGTLLSVGGTKIPWTAVTGISQVSTAGGTPT